MGKHYHIQGRVQGVGFRPFVARLAAELGLTGNVMNSMDGVHIELQGTTEQIEKFDTRLGNELPPTATISRLTQRNVAENANASGGFSILPSNRDHLPDLKIPSDLAMCPKCAEDMEELDNRRRGYAFTTCTNCGPRYSVITDLPYDRNRTSMADFTPCQKCSDEYSSTSNRRFHSQSNSCPDCGVQLYWLGTGERTGNELNEAISKLRAGQIVAIKGVGGFLLLGDATNEEVVNDLRNRKHRPSKPFACLFSDVEAVKMVCELDPIEEVRLTDSTSPIVLLNTLLEAKNELALNAIAPSLNRLGVMLPNAPLLHLISKRFGAPLVATSGNASGMPICFNDEQASEYLIPIADAVLSHDRPIQTPLDDSVVVFSKAHRKEVILRRARGMAPESALKPQSAATGLLALGAEMKSAFAIQHGASVHASAYLGDTSGYDSQKSFKIAYHHLSGLLQFKPTVIVHDAHPDYFTSNWARQLADEWLIERFEVQHHKAHLASVLWEHERLPLKEEVLGFVWDGTGYGDDGHIWGSETFLVRNNQMERVGHLNNVPVLANSRMMKEPPVALLSMSMQCEERHRWQSHLPERDLTILEAMWSKETLMTSSMGRLFDAVGALLLNLKMNSFEGEAAMKLQQLAEGSNVKTWEPFDLDFNSPQLDPAVIVSSVFASLQYEEKERVALRFHQTLVEWVAGQAALHGIHTLAFSGGVFQNTLLVDLVIDRLSANHALLFHTHTSPNDEGVALGQLAYVQYFNQGVLSSNRKKEALCA